jgi:hypothetical protein
MINVPAPSVFRAEGCIATTAQNAVEEAMSSVSHRNAGFPLSIDLASSLESDRAELT